VAAARNTVAAGGRLLFASRNCLDDPGCSFRRRWKTRAFGKVRGISEPVAALTTSTWSGSTRTGTPHGAPSGEFPIAV